MKSFDEWFNKEYSNYGDSYKELYDEDSDSYNSEFVDDRYGAFQAGQQSKQAEVDELRKRLTMYEREGYKFVPVKPTQEMIYAGESAEHKGCISVAVVYKAMIGACDD